MRIAAFDIGANSIKLVVADYGAGRLTPILEAIEQTRLGQSGSAGHLTEAAMRRTLDGLRRLRDAANTAGAQRFVAAGASALRAAANRDAFIELACSECGLEVDTLSERAEANLAYLSVANDDRWKNAAALAVVDVGGGSTEIAAGAGSRMLASISAPVGAVVITQRRLAADPPPHAALKAAAEEAAWLLQNSRPPGFPGQNSSAIVAVGGTAVTLACLEYQITPAQAHGAKLTRDRIAAWIESLAALDPPHRQKVKGMLSERADVMVGGAIVLHAALEQIGAPAAEVSIRGLQWGLLYREAGRLSEGKPVHGNDPTRESFGTGAG